MKTEFTDRSVLVTGATGFIGTHLVARLLREGAQVHALVRPGRYLRVPPEWAPGVSIVEADLSDRDALASLAAGVRPSLVFHLAAHTNVSRDVDQIEAATRANLHGTINLLQALRSFPPECTLVVGSAEEYGDQAVPFHEDMALDPRSPYSASKAAAILWSQMWHRMTGFPIVMVRPFLTYGPGQSTDRLVPQAIVAALEEREFPMTLGEQTREFTFIDDIVDGLFKAVTTPDAVGEIINLGAGDEIKIVDLVNKIFELVGSSSRPLPGAIAYREAEIWRYVAATEKAKRILNWTATTPLDDGLTTTIAWYRSRLRDAEPYAQKSLGFQAQTV